MTINTPTRALGDADQLFIGPQIRRHRELEGLTQKEVGWLVHVDPSVISLWELDERPVPHNRVPRLAQALAVSMDTLLAGARVVTEGYYRYSDSSQLPPAEPLAPPPLPPLAPAPPPRPLTKREVEWWEGPKGSVRIMTIAEFWGGTDTGAYVSLRSKRSR